MVWDKYDIGSNVSGDKRWLIWQIIHWIIKLFWELVKFTSNDCCQYFQAGYPVKPAQSGCKMRKLADIDGKIVISKNEAGKNSDLVFIPYNVRNFGRRLGLVVA